MRLEPLTEKEQAALNIGYRYGRSDAYKCTTWEWDTVAFWTYFPINEISWAYIKTLRLIRRYTAAPTIMWEEPDAPQDDPT